ncbi:hydrogenase assembly chaperone hypC/hupF [Ammonifex degensii KC4]|uniref:Hydrogenase assembly chaperone hypC/hupF n=1 Tax=Ammonifex degensii (strain DSM 10501 / KC4) TaxID=429009 RepID=C9R9V7_AMMDK|nr:HypC/HybG/HupF family hydrogenase formation chaperone [Ammonifex degensii]ACX53086.1 hydrogenase assembly chaperone hypC/hupF [Ammonifex degensii KC4]
MCLGIPGRIVEVYPEEHVAVIETFGVRQRVSTFLIGEVEVGEYVMVHAGYAIEKIDVEEARERLKLWEEILKYADMGETERPGDRT